VAVAGPEVIKAGTLTLIVFSDQDTTGAVEEELWSSSKLTLPPLGPKPLPLMVTIAPGTPFGGDRALIVGGPVVVVVELVVVVVVPGGRVVVVVGEGLVVLVTTGFVVVVTRFVVVVVTLDFAVVVVVFARVVVVAGEVVVDWMVVANVVDEDFAPVACTGFDRIAKKTAPPETNARARITAAILPCVPCTQARPRLGT
jgi:hypothetical protein